MQQIYKWRRDCSWLYFWRIFRFGNNIASVCLPLWTNISFHWNDFNMLKIHFGCISEALFHEAVEAVEYIEAVEAEEYIVQKVFSWSQWFFWIISFPCFEGEEQLLYYNITWKGGMVSPGAPILHYIIHGRPLMKWPVVVGLFVATILKVVFI